MIATIINACSVVLGTVLGLLLRHRVSEKLKDAVLAGAGIITLIIGLMMAFKTERVLYLALSIIVGGILGTILKLEDHIQGLGKLMLKLVPRKDRPQKLDFPDSAEPVLLENPENQRIENFARGFKEASVLFCAGSMTILGSIQSALGDYSLLLTKSVLDGFMAIVMAASLGLGVGFAGLSILLYQGLLTLLGVGINSFLTPLMLSSISGAGGALVMMIGLGLLGIKKIPAGNFLPALVIIVIFAAFDPYIPQIFHS